MKNSTMWLPGAAKTFRNKSRKILKTYGTNLQNPSDASCQLHIPRKGCRFIQADLDGAEALVFGYLCRAGKYRDLAIYGVKQHSYVAMNLYAQQWKEETGYDAPYLCELEIKDVAAHTEWKLLAKIIKENKDRYFIGKKTNLSFNYGKGAATFRFDVLKESGGAINLSLEESQKFEAIQHGRFPEIKEYYYSVEQELKNSRTITNLYGHPTRYDGAITNKTIREWVAWRAQSTVGELASNVFAGMQDWIESEGIADEVDVLNNKHDSVLCQCPPAYEAAVIKKLSELMCVNFVGLDGTSFKMKVAVSVGMNWGSYDEKTNIEGMREIKT